MAHKQPAEQGHAAHGIDIHAPGADKSPAFIGLIVGGIALFAILFGVVRLTNAQFKGHEPQKEAAAEARH